MTAPDGARLSTYVHTPRGLADDAPTVVLAHGWVLTYRSWLPVVRLLADRGDVRVVAWDQRGHGASTYAGGSLRPRGESIRALGDDLATVVDAVVPAASSLVLGGHSMGGMTVMAFAGRHPEVFADRVRRVLLASTAIGGLRGPGLPFERRVMALAARVPGRPSRLMSTRSARRQFGTVAAAADVAATRAMLGAARLGTYGTYYGALMDHDESEAASVLAQVPVTVVVGTRDILTPRTLGERIAEAVPGAELQVIEGVGHMTPYEVPDQLAAALTP
ncbi:alpha/beta hydrolase [Luteipulveratus sp. YIM 133132]|uniref:alpha/beta fold hydrolase n=1 Tax=Luteipulveratus flavus TaxID=3031728 RepID=UPI0023B1EE1E|nr:alpha/beta hydrolase [Luteipulveratus sp. YIM 133132]MDE9365578.1 alpha/beta hydrolase [Luteipulveratus sp. YIM 133132]